MAQAGPFLGGVPVTSRDIPGKSIDTGHLRNLPVYALATIFFKETNRSLMTAPGVNDPSPATCFFCKYNDVNVLYVTIGKIASSGVLVERLVGLGFLSSVSYITPIPTHEKIFAGGRRGPNTTFNLIFLGLGWPWVGEFGRFIVIFILFPTQQNLVNRKKP